MPIEPFEPNPDKTVNETGWENVPPSTIRTRNGDTNLMMPAKFYIDDHLLPVTPHTFSIKQNSKNESDSLFDGRPYTRARLMNAQTMNIEFTLPYFFDSRICESTWDSRRAWTDFFYTIMRNCQPVVVSIQYSNDQEEPYSQKWLLDSWDYTQTGENGSDWDISLTFTEWYPTDNMETDFVLENPNIPVGQRDARRV